MHFRLAPSSILVIAVALGLLPAIAAVIWPEAMWVMVIANIVLLCFALGDGILGYLRLRRIECTIETAGIWSCGRDANVRTFLSHQMPTALSLQVVPDVPQTIEISKRDEPVTIEAGAQTELTIRCRPQKRGSFILNGLHLGLTSPLKLWRLARRCGTAHAISVYPNLRQIGEYGLLARTNRLGLIGVRQVMKTGGDTEFERLRLYQNGDPLSRIDWRATARRDQPTVRDYRHSRNQNVMLLLDAGRMLTGTYTTEDGAIIPVIDNALNACLLLAHVALSQGDRVGLMVYNDSIRRHLPLDGGMRQLDRIAHALHDIEALPTESRHDLAYLEMGRRVRQRSLVVHVTAFLDDLNGGLIRRHLVAQRGRHLPLGVVLRHPSIEERVTHLPATPDEIPAHAAAIEIAQWREKHLQQLENGGVLVVDTTLEALTGKLLSAYLDIKARHLL